MSSQGIQNKIEVLSEKELSPKLIVPSVFDKSVPYAVAEAVAEAARTDGVCRA